MMPKIAVSLKINLDKIDAARVFNGAKGNYLDATVFIDLDELDQYGNSGMITQSVDKEEKEKGVKGNILGNAKVFWKEGGQAPTTTGPVNQQSWGSQQGGGSWGDPWAGLVPAGAAAHLTVEQIKQDPSINGNAQAALNFGWVTKG